MLNYFLVNPMLKDLWKEEYEEWSLEQKQFMEKVVELFKKELDKISESVVQCF